MTFFRSEEHLRRSAQFKPDTAEGIIPLTDLVKLFSIDFFRRRMDANYVSRMREYTMDFIPVLMEIGKVGPFWSLKKPRTT